MAARFILFVNKTFSETGQVRLRSRIWSDEPEVEFNLLSDRRDLERIADGIHRLTPLFDMPAMRLPTRRSCCHPWKPS